jgi:hypothetical protein
MAIYWTSSSIPELAGLSPAQRRRAMRAVFWKAHAHWQVWLSLVPMIVLIIVGSNLGRETIGLEWVGSAIGAGVGSLFYSAVQQRFARLYLPAEVRRLQDER